MRIACVLGTRPEAIKLAPVILALRASADLRCDIVSTGQHRELTALALEGFGLSADADLALMRPHQTLSELTSRALSGLAPWLALAKPDLVLVQGDTTSALAGALAAFYAGIPVGHVEAGLRSGNPAAPWPEETNRRLISRLAHWHFAPTLLAAAQLRAEGLKADTITVTGNTGIDALLMVAARLEGNAALAERFAFLDPDRRLILVTGHRRESFGRGLARLAWAVGELAARADVQVVYVMHLNPKAAAPALAALRHRPHVHLLPPQEHAAFIWLMQRAHLIITDSGGVQEEAPSLGRPVLVARDVSDRPEAITAGTARLVGTDGTKLLREAVGLLDDPAAWRAMARAGNPYGDGHAAARILQVLLGRVAPAERAARRPGRPRLPLPSPIAGEMPLLEGI